MARFFIYLFIYDCLVKHLDMLFNFFLKIDLIWFDGINLVVIPSIFLLMKYVSLKKIVLVVGQINKK